MNILVTGGAGFIGSNLIHYLLREAEAELGLQLGKVVNLDCLSYAGNLANLAEVEADSRYHFVHGSINDRGLVRELLKRHEIDAIMHLAAESHVDRSIDGPDDFVETNFVGTFSLLEEFRHYLSQVKKSSGMRFFHISTDEVYGSLGKGDAAFSESTGYAPNSPYSATKAGSDHLVRAYHHTYELPVLTTNCSNNYGPFQFPEKLIPLMIQRLLSGQKLPVYGDGSQVRDWLYVKDHVRGLVQVLLSGRVGETYLMGGGAESQLTNLNLVHLLIETVQQEVPSVKDRSAEEWITFVKDRPGHDQRYAINADKISQELDWQPQDDLSSGLTKTVQWYLENRAWAAEIERKSYRGERLGQEKSFF